MHRPAYSDYVVLKRFDEQGNVIGGYCFVGLYTSYVYTESPHRIPVIQQKISYVMDRCGFGENSHVNKELSRILAVHPRDELFHSSAQELLETVLGILNLQERRQIRVFVRQNSENLFFNCIVFIPRDLYNTDSRIRIEEEILKHIPAKEVEFTTFFSESVLCRTHFISKLDRPLETLIDVKSLEQKVIRAARTWEDEFFRTLGEAYGEALGSRYWQKYQGAFSASYREDFTPQSAVADIHHLERLSDSSKTVMSFYRAVGETDDIANFKLFNLSGSIPLSDIIPVLENLGLRILGEHSYEVKIQKDQKTFFIQNFILRPRINESIDIQAVRSIFQEAFDAIWNGFSENDSFNELVLSANLHWREISLLRALSGYLKQVRFNFSQHAIASTLVKNQKITLLLVRLFHARFLPLPSNQADQDQPIQTERENPDENALNKQFHEALEAVDNLNEDVILRRLYQALKAILRCNFYQKDEQGQSKKYLAFKFDPSQISGVPKPCPVFEIYIYSPEFEGVHLRGGKVARGGLRWSDRLEDFRTEVLGLVKAQQVKNAVIVPVGAKGGFVARKIPAKSTREEIHKIGVYCYREFISGLLDLTDNLVDGAIVPPQQVVRYDEDDPYLVVAADKGTATFSDIANEIAVKRGFWLGDAFASGGSIGYDHKKMGITARGAWVSVQRHFRELGINVQTTSVSCLGIGDMSGDVFGNGLLLSEYIGLVAAFNHQHIFLDPNPDPQTSYVERKRLFELPRSTWEDYNSELISSGGGVYSRSSKSISLTEAVKQRFGIQDNALSPNELIHQLLKSAVDLIWNGGIGTYVKASHETHETVGDKANDVLRVNGNELKARVIGEGGNLGLTQLARIEFAQQGGICFTDFIDNAGGVDCSDHEVNIKVLLNEVVAAGELTNKQRNELLLSMTHEVAQLVLKNNYRQAQAIAFAEFQSIARFEEYHQVMLSLESDGKLDRGLEFLPDEEGIKERQANGQGLTRPEIAVLVSYLKADLKQQLQEPGITNDPYLQGMIETAFPSALMTKFKAEIYQHRLKNEIVATQLANDIINRNGIAFLHRLQSSTRANMVEIAQSYAIIRDVYDLEVLSQEVEALDDQVATTVQYQLLEEFVHLTRRACRWILINSKDILDIGQIVNSLTSGIAAIRQNMDQLLIGEAKAHWSERKAQLMKSGVPEIQANLFASTTRLYPALGIVEAANRTSSEVLLVAKIYYALGERIGLGWFSQSIHELPVSSHWEALARETLRDDLDLQQRTITLSVLRSVQHLRAQVCADKGREDNAFDLTEEDLNITMDQWCHEHQRWVHRWKEVLNSLKNAEVTEFAMYTVAMRELCDLAMNTAPDNTVEKNM